MENKKSRRKKVAADGLEDKKEDFLRKSEHIMCKFTAQVDRNALRKEKTKKMVEAYEYHNKIKLNNLQHLKNDLSVIIGQPEAEWLIIRFTNTTNVLLRP